MLQQTPSDCQPTKRLNLALWSPRQSRRSYWSSRSLPEGSSDTEALWRVSQKHAQRLSKVWCWSPWPLLWTVARFLSLSSLAKNYFEVCRFTTQSNDCLFVDYSRFYSILTVLERYFHSIWLYIYIYICFNELFVLLKWWSCSHLCLLHPIKVRPCFWSLMMIYCKYSGKWPGIVVITLLSAA